jgi:hypothetical protein
VQSGAGAVITTVGWAPLQETRESVRNPEPRSVQTDNMRTGELKKISKAPVETLESWHASISRNPESMTMMVRDLDVALHKLGGPKPADTEKRNDISKAVHGAGQALLKAAHSPFGHAGRGLRTHSLRPPMGETSSGT